MAPQKKSTNNEGDAATKTTAQGRRQRSSSSSTSPSGKGGATKPHPRSEVAAASTAVAADPAKATTRRKSPTTITGRVSPSRRGRSNHLDTLAFASDGGAGIPTVTTSNNTSSTQRQIHKETLELLPASSSSKTTSVTHRGRSGDGRGKRGNPSQNFAAIVNANQGSVGPGLDDVQEDNQDELQPPPIAPVGGRQKHADLLSKNVGTTARVPTADGATVEEAEVVTFTGPNGDGTEDGTESLARSVHKPNEPPLQSDNPGGDSFGRPDEAVTGVAHELRKRQPDGGATVGVNQQKPTKKSKKKRKAVAVATSNLQEEAVMSSNSIAVPPEQQPQEKLDRKERASKVPRAVAAPEDPVMAESKVAVDVFAATNSSDSSRQTKTSCGNVASDWNPHDAKQDDVPMVNAEKTTVASAAAAREYDSDGNGDVTMSIVEDAAAVQTLPAGTLGNCPPAATSVPRIAQRKGEGMKATKRSWSMPKQGDLVEVPQGPVSVDAAKAAVEAAVAEVGLPRLNESLNDSKVPASDGPESSAVGTSAPNRSTDLSADHGAVTEQAQFELSDAAAASVDHVSVSLPKTAPIAAPKSKKRTHKLQAATTAALEHFHQPEQDNSELPPTKMHRHEVGRDAVVTATDDHGDMAMTSKVVLNPIRPNAASAASLAAQPCNEATVPQLSGPDDPERTLASTAPLASEEWEIGLGHGDDAPVTRRTEQAKDPTASENASLSAVEMAARAQDDSTGIQDAGSDDGVIRPPALDVDMLQSSSVVLAAAAPTAAQPREKTVVYCGSGHHSKPGNMEYNELCRSLIPEYTNANPARKEEMVDELMEIFDFRRGNNKAEDSFAREKIGKLLRDSRKLQGSPKAPPKAASTERATKQSRRSAQMSKADRPAPERSNGKVVVYCGEGNASTKRPGNVLYQRSVSAAQAKWQKASDHEQQVILADLLGRFEFRRWIDGELKVEQEKWAKDKVRKALSDTRRRQSALPPRLPTEQPVSMHLHSFLTKPYREELAYHHFEGLSPHDCVRDPLPPPDDIPKAPDDGLVSWTYTESNRVYLGDFSRVGFVPETHKSFLGELMERDDITVLCEGLLLGLSTRGRKQFLKYVGQAFGNDPHHKFRRFERQDKDGVVSYQECQGYVSMYVAEFLKYLEILYEEPGAADSFTLTNAKGKLENIAAADTKNHVFYMIDVDMPKNLVQLNDEYMKNFKIKEILPGGAWCMMNALAEQSRPFMGPNCYITPGGGFTQVHQDGHGTVDSGHSCLLGYNEVVILRRLPDCHKHNACRMVPSLKECTADEKAHNMLFRLPHDDGRKDAPAWPSDDTIEYWGNMGYCPSVIILKPGQHMLINKGRLHAFRKMTPEDLPVGDCHKELREALINSPDFHPSPLCVSVAFDWMFMGITAEGINREIAANLECNSICREKDCKSLAIPETCLLKIASSLPASAAPNETKQSVLLEEANTYIEQRPSFVVIARGILPSLCHVRKKERDASTLSRPKAGGEAQKVPDSALDSTQSSVDPFGSDYFCKLCSVELCNTYYHCDGCETLLSKDFNVCASCYQEGKFKVFHVMHSETEKQQHSNRHHTGAPKKCSCKVGKIAKVEKCVFCRRSMICCCTCHTFFSQRRRFYSEADLDSFVARAENLAGDEHVMYAFETENRLNRIAMVAAEPRDEEQVANDANEDDGNNSNSHGHSRVDSSSDEVVLQPEGKSNGTEQQLLSSAVEEMAKDGEVPLPHDPPAASHTDPPHFRDDDGNLQARQEQQRRPGRHNRSRTSIGRLESPPSRHGRHIPASGATAAGAAAAASVVAPLLGRPSGSTESSTAGKPESLDDFPEQQLELPEEHKQQASVFRTPRPNNKQQQPLQHSPPVSPPLPPWNPHVDQRSPQSTDGEADDQPPSPPLSPLKPHQPPFGVDQDSPMSTYEEEDEFIRQQLAERPTPQLSPSSSSGTPSSTSRHGSGSTASAHVQVVVEQERAHQLPSGVDQDSPMSTYEEEDEFIRQQLAERPTPQLSTGSSTGTRSSARRRGSTSTASAREVGVEQDRATPPPRGRGGSRSSLSSTAGSSSSLSLKTTTPSSIATSSSMASAIATDGKACVANTSTTSSRMLRRQSRVEGVAESIPRPIQLPHFDKPWSHPTSSEE